MSLVFDVRSAHTHFPPWLYLGSYHRVRRGGLAAYSFSEMKHWPLHYVPENAPPPKPPLWVFQPCTFRNAVDGEYYDYVLVYGDTAENRIRYSNDSAAASVHGSAFTNDGDDTIDASAMLEQNDAFVGVVIDGALGNDVISGSQDDDHLAGGGGRTPSTAARATTTSTATRRSTSMRRCSRAISSTVSTRRRS